MRVSPSRRDDKLEVVLKHADAQLEEWFRRTQKETRKASLRFGAFLRHAKGQTAGAFRHEVDELQAGLKKLSTRLDRVERQTTPAPKKPRTYQVIVAAKKRRARPAAAPKAAKSSTAASVRKRKKAA